MTHDDAFMQAIIEAPDDDSLRLIYADYLDERGDPRGEFIRVQCELAQTPADNPRRAELEARERKWLEEHEEEWGGPLRDLLKYGSFRRGFLEEVRLELEAFLAHADALFRVAPIRRLRLDRAAEFLADLTQSPYLSRLLLLDLSENRIGPDGVWTVADCPYLSELTELDLWGNPVLDSGAVGLANSPHLCRLAVLHLGNAGIGDPGIEALATSPYLVSLNRLDLACNCIGPRGIEALVASPHLCRLTYLDLCGNDLDIAESAKQALRARFGHGVEF